MAARAALLGCRLGPLAEGESDEELAAAVPVVVLCPVAELAGALELMLSEEAEGAVDSAGAATAC